MLVNLPPIAYRVVRPWASETTTVATPKRSLGMLARVSQLPAAAARVVAAGRASASGSTGVSRHAARLRATANAIWVRVAFMLGSKTEEANALGTKPAQHQSSGQCGIDACVPSSRSQVSPPHISTSALCTRTRRQLPICRPNVMLPRPWPIGQGAQLGIVFLSPTQPHANSQCPRHSRGRQARGSRCGIADLAIVIAAPAVAHPDIGGDATGMISMTAQLAE